MMQFLRSLFCKTYMYDGVLVRYIRDDKKKDLCVIQDIDTGSIYKVQKHLLTKV